MFLFIFYIYYYICRKFQGDADATGAHVQVRNSPKYELQDTNTGSPTLNFEGAKLKSVPLENTSLSTLPDHAKQESEKKSTQSNILKNKEHFRATAYETVETNGTNVESQPRDGKIKTLPVTTVADAANTDGSTSPFSSRTARTTNNPIVRGESARLLSATSSPDLWRDVSRHDVGSSLDGSLHSLKLRKEKVFT